MQNIYYLFENDRKTDRGWPIAEHGFYFNDSARLDQFIMMTLSTIKQTLLLLSTLPIVTVLFAFIIGVAITKL